MSSMPEGRVPPAVQPRAVSDTLEGVEGISATLFGEGAERPEGYVAPAK